MRRIINFFKYLFNDPSYVLFRVLSQKWVPITDKCYLKIWYKVKTGKKLNLDHPQTYNEKLQWLKLYDHRPIYTTMVDKYAVKEFVAQIIGAEYVIPLLGVWERPEDIDFDALPNQFVLKVTHGGGSFGVIVCRDKESLNRREAIKTLISAMKIDGYWLNREWPYKNVPRRVIAEEYKEDVETKELRDYKFFCFDGEPKLLFVATGRATQEEPNFDWFDMSYQHIPLKTEHPNSDINHLPQKPACFEEMKDVAARLSAGLPQVRIDLYEVNGKVYFGEYTFFHWSGINRFEPEEWNERMGEWITLPQRS